MTQRTGFVLHVRPDKIEEYVSAHRNVWPEMLDALRAAGIHNYTIFRAGTSVFGYFEAADLDFAAAFLEAQQSTAVGRTQWLGCSRSASRPCGARGGCAREPTATW